jgi:hypothetical protein
VGRIKAYVVRQVLHLSRVRSVGYTPELAIYFGASDMQYIMPLKKTVTSYTFNVNFSL